MKKFIIGSILGVAIILVSLFYILKSHQPPIDSVFKAIPTDAAAIVDILNYANLRSSLDKNNTLWKSASAYPFFREIESHLSLIDSLQGSYTSINEIIAANPEIFISLHPSTKEDFLPVYYFKLHSKADAKHLNEIIASMQGADINERRYAGEKITDVILPSTGKFSWVYIRGLFIISPSSLLIENVVQQINTNKPTLFREGLDDLVKSAGRNFPANIYFRNKSIPGIFTNYTDSLYLKTLNLMSNSGGWTELDLNMKNNLLVLDGLTTSGNKSGYPTLFEGQKPIKTEILQAIPSSCISAFSVGISNLKLFLLKQQQYLSTSEPWKVIIKNRKNIEEKIQPGFIITFDTLFDGECAKISIPSGSDSLSGKSLSIIRIKSQDDATKLLTNWVNTLTDSLGKKPSDFITETGNGNNEKYKIWYLPDVNIPIALFGPVLGDKRNEYCLIYENYLVFAQSPRILKEYLQALNSNNSLLYNPEILSVSDNLASSSNLFCYYNLTSKTENWTQFYNRSLLKNISPENPNLTAGIFVYQLSSGKEKIYNNLLIKAAGLTEPDSTSTNTEAAWQFQLEGPLKTKPYIVKNNKGEAFIFVQDENNILYCLNMNGLLQWKLTLDGPVLSNFYPLDNNRNHKTQYLFNTPSKLYLVDRLGKNAEHFPITFKNDATNGIAVFDYEHNQNYRIYYANNAREIVVLDKEGHKQDGWIFDKTESYVKGTIQHFRFDNADYLVFNDNKRIYILNRKGEERIKPKSNITVSANNKVYLLPAKEKQKTRFVTTDSTGTIYTIDTKGEISSLSTGIYPSQHYFEVRDIDSDNIPDFIVAYDQYIKIFSQDKKELLSLNTGNSFSEAPSFYELQPHIYKIGVVIASKNKIYLYDTRGNLSKGFPLKGSTLFSMMVLNNSGNRFNLIVGTNNNFLYSYTVQ